LKQIEVQILGQSYLLACPEGGEQQLLEAVEKVDSAMCKIRDAGKVKARDRIAVLASLNLAFETAASESRAASFAASSFVNTEIAPEAHSNGSDARISALMTRLDSALGDDGQLL
jgi:cell division protein ZapA